MKKIIISILLLFLMGCSSEAIVSPTDTSSECLECFGDYYIDENGFCVCD